MRFRRVTAISGVANRDQSPTCNLSSCSLPASRSFQTSRPQSQSHSQSYCFSDISDLEALWSELCWFLRFNPPFLFAGYLCFSTTNDSIHNEHLQCIAMAVGTMPLSL